MLSQAWKALWHRPTRSVIGLLQALLGALVVTLALALAFTQDRAANTSPDLTQLTAGSRANNNTVTFSMFAPADLPKLQRLTPDVLKLDLVGMQFISGLEVGTARYKLSDSKATGPDYPALTGLKVLHGSYFNRKDVEAGAKVVALSANTALALYGRENAVGERLRLVPGMPGSVAIPYRVVAITEAARQGLRGVASPLFMPVAVGGAEKASGLLVLARPGRLTQAKSQVLAAVRQQFKNDPQIKGLQAKGQSGFFFTSPSDPFFQAGTGVNPMLRAYYAIAALTLTVSGLGVLSGLLVSVQERTRELGLRRAIGATRGQIVAGLLLETLLTTWLGALLGVALALLLAPSLNALFGTLLGGARLTVGVGLAGTVLGLFVGLALLFGLVPALASTRLRPTEALRMQG